MKSFISSINNNKENIDLVLIASKQGIEYGYKKEYYDFYASRHVYSITKSFVSLAIGYLIEEDRLSLDTPIINYFKTYSNTKYKDVLIYHLLNNTTGIDEELNLLASDDWIALYFNAPLKYKAGTHYYYCNLNSYILSVIITKITKQTLQQYLYDHLFKHLDINVNFELHQGYNIGCFGMHISIYDLCKIAIAILNKEKYLPLDYMKQMTKTHVITNKFTYGYLCYTYGSDYYFLGMLGHIVYFSKDYAIIMFSKRFDINKQIYEMKNLKVDTFIITGKYYFKENIPELLPLPVAILERRFQLQDLVLEIEYKEYHYYLKYNDIQIIVNNIEYKEQVISYSNKEYIIKVKYYNLYDYVIFHIVYINLAHSKYILIKKLDKRYIGMYFIEEPDLKTYIDQYIEHMVITKYDRVNKIIVKTLYTVINKAYIGKKKNMER